MMEPELLKDFHDYGANIATREIFLHNHYHAEDNQTPALNIGCLIPLLRT
jgi:hypothetical protein